MQLHDCCSADLSRSARVRGRRGHETRRPRAALFDRDGTLVEDVPWNGDPSLLVARPGAAVALRMLRDAGLATAVVSNQSGIARGFISHDEAASVFTRLDDELGPFDAMAWCHHAI